YRCLGTDGSDRWLDLCAVPIRGGDGRIAMILYRARDVTEPKNTREALIASERRFRALVENAFDTTVIVDARGAIVFESPSAERPRDWPALVAGRNVTDNVHPEDLPEARRLLRELAAQPGARVRGIQVRARLPDGKCHW